MRTFEILSRSQAKRASYKFDRPTIVVSIYDIVDGPAKFYQSTNLIGVCSVAFSDIESAQEDGLLMTTEDAIKIKNFIDKYWDRAEHIVVHCYAGVSRSAGCMSAILRAKGEDDSWIWNSKRFSPNTFVARKILEAYGIGRDNYEELWNELAKLKDWK